MKKRGFFRSFISFLSKLIVVLACMALIAFASFQGVTRYLTGEFFSLEKLKNKQTAAANKEPEEEEIENLNNEDMEPTLIFVESSDPDKVYVALNLYNKKTKAFDLILMPSDAEVAVSGDTYNKLKTKMPDAEGTVTLSEVSKKYGEDKYEMLSSILGDLCGMDILGYDVMTSGQFSSFLDSCGPVPYKLDHMMSYRNEEGRLREIDGGEQELDGDDSIVVLKYLDGMEDQESSRLERVSEYMNALFKHISSHDAGREAGDAYARLADSTRGEDVTGFSDILSKMSADKYMVRIMQYSEKKGVYSLDDQKVQLQLSALVKQTDGKSSADSDSKEDQSGSDSENGSTEDYSGSDSRSSSIELYNAAYVSQLAGGWREYLESEGYNITVAGTYQDEGPISQTRIRVTEAGKGRDLLKYFPNAEITEVGATPSGGDIAIYIGTDYTEIPEISADATTRDEDTDYSFDDPDEADEVDQSE